jgi:hypothetical protein
VKDTDIFNAADEEQVEEQEKKGKTKRDQELEDIKMLLSLPQGLRFFRRLMDIGHVFSTSFTGNSTTFFNEGMRNVALKIFNDVCEASPEKAKYVMIKTEGENLYDN